MRKQIQIPVLGQFRVMSALHENLRAAQRQRLLNLAVHFLVSNHIGVIILFLSHKRTEFAVYIADVGIVDVAVDTVGHDLISTPVIRLRLGQFPSSVRQSAQCLQWQFIKSKRFLC